VDALLSSSGDLAKTSTTKLFSWFEVLGLLTAHPRYFRKKLLTSENPVKPKMAKPVGVDHGQANTRDADIGEADEELLSMVPSASDEERPFDCASKLFSHKAAHSFQSTSLHYG
jgi:hypothetical protein